ncbi:L-fucose isomerase-like protein [Algibacter agarivorans]|uniref:L-fucose isomerase-like protein n=1 Tax=Algibacter agarivorans TaxID=1109741 RepID=A0ABP9GFZ9_9FLAO
MVEDNIGTPELKESIDTSQNTLDFLNRKGVVAKEMEQLITPKQTVKKVSIGLIGIGFELHFDWEKAKKSYSEALQQTKRAMGENNSLLAPKEPVQTKADLLALLNEYNAQGMSGLIIYQASYIAGDLALALANWLREHAIPLLSWSHDEVTGGRLTANRLCGQNFLLNILNGMEVKYSWVVNAPKSLQLDQVLDRFIRVVTAKKHLQNSTVLMIGGMRVPGFYDCELNELSISKHFGLGIDRVDIETVWRYGEKFAKKDIDKIVSKLINDENCGLSKVNERELFLSVRFSLAIADYARQGNYLGVALKNWPELFDNYKIAGDGAGALVQDLGIPISDESDMGGLITMVAINEITQGKALPTLMDLSILNAEENKLGMWHCGGSPTRLLRSGTKFEVRNHSILDNYDEAQSYGMLLEFLLEKGAVTIAKYQYPHASDMLSFEGKIIDSPMRFRGAYGEIVTQNVKASAVVGTILSKGLDHHWIVGRGHFQEDLKEFNHWANVQDIAFVNEGLSGRSIQKHLNY